MSKADEMFEKLGYIDIEKSSNGIEYFDSERNAIGFFEDMTEGIDKSITIDKFMGLTMTELQAINEKCKELNWLGE